MMMVHAIPYAEAAAALNLFFIAARIETHSMFSSLWAQFFPMTFGALILADAAYRLGLFQ